VDQWIAGAKAFIAANKVAFYAGLALLVGLVLLLAYCQGRDDGKTGEVAKQQKATIQLEQDASKADAAAADQRVKDAVTITEQKKELDDAIEAGEDPATLRVRRGCLIMRQQGRDTSAIAACSRFQAGN